MDEYAGVNVRLSREEFERLRDTARRDLRHPRDQARYLLRLALGLAIAEESTQETQESTHAPTA